jgi:hypothetical protein
MYGTLYKWKPRTIDERIIERRKTPWDRIETCNICDRIDVVFPTGSFHLCPRCAKRGRWDIKGTEMRIPVQITRSGFCDICGVHFLGVGLTVIQAMACHRCLWTKLGHQRGALRVGGERFV